MNANNNENIVLQKELEKLQKIGNRLHKEQMNNYGKLRGFKKPLSILLQNELDGGEFRELNAVEINTYKMVR
ncbi:MAG: Unknown protein [uncultured Sulfurovum sp.]|uniref:Uncharacterized protein n=1 Tax=uncultured Sulfurovum sp. TaxID=269237 RepID=A0A6S6TSG5_9BACT|nr:MAG: Unknown protein [uncultured Sulfurovum sp.]